MMDKNGKQIKECSKLLIIRKISMKNSELSPYSGWLLAKRKKVTRAGKDVEKRKLPHYWWE